MSDDQPATPRSGSPSAARRSLRRSLENLQELMDDDPLAEWVDILNEARDAYDGQLDLAHGYWLALHWLDRPPSEATEASPAASGACGKQDAMLDDLRDDLADTVRQLQSRLRRPAREGPPPSNEHAAADDAEAGTPRSPQQHAPQSDGSQRRQRSARQLGADVSRLGRLLPLVAAHSVGAKRNLSADEAYLALLGVATRIGWRAAEVHYADELDSAAKNRSDRKKGGLSTSLKAKERDFEKQFLIAVLGTPADDFKSLADLRNSCCIAPLRRTLAENEALNSAHSKLKGMSYKTFRKYLNELTARIGRRVVLRADATGRDEAISTIAGRYAAAAKISRREVVASIAWMYDRYLRDLKKRGVDFEFLPPACWDLKRLSSSSVAAEKIGADPLRAALDALASESASPDA
ncbi:MAG: hypothetical protein CMJ58_27480 [Planctomycetaceae bacterium]|nr:hypothetical protein [Planctomycetaceae bacterium]